MNDQLFNSTVQSLVRAGLMAAAGALAIEVREGDLNTTVGVVTSILLTAISVFWSASTHKKNINTPPPPTGSGGSGGTLGLILAFLMAGAMLGGTVTMTGCKGGGITALLNCNVLTTGFDAPNVECILSLRPTASPGLYEMLAVLGRDRAVSRLRGA